jgi:dephospho-CoA kinase
MVRVALTGGIATGKSTVLGLLRQRGIPTIDADVLAREVVAPGAPAYSGVVARFGPGVLDDIGAIDRRALAAIVFADAVARRDLEHIIHPAVYEAIAGWFAALPESTRLAVADIPLLFETERERDFDKVVVVACPADEQVRRVMARDGATEGEARARISAQWPVDRKVAAADHVIWTTGTHADTERQVADLLRVLDARIR